MNALGKILFMLDQCKFHFYYLRQNPASLLCTDKGQTAGDGEREKRFLEMYRKMIRSCVMFKKTLKR